MSSLDEALANALAGRRAGTDPIAVQLRAGLAGRLPDPEPLSVSAPPALNAPTLEAQLLASLNDPTTEEN